MNVQNRTAFNFSDFKFQKTYTDKDMQDPSKRKGLSDCTNTATSNHGYVNKIRRDSLSGKPRERKVSLVDRNKMGFKSTNCSSPMDVDVPLMKIRNLMTSVPHGVTDIDAVCDPLKNTDYAQDICDYLQALERRFTLPRNIRHNPEITANMRGLLMDWLIQVQVHQELSQYTLHLCVNIVDQFMCKQQLKVNVLQLVGITAMLISAKYYERFPPEIADLCHLTDDTYTPAQVIKMERMILRKLDFSLNIPGPVVFLERFLLVIPCDKQNLIQSMSMYFLDLTLSDLSFIHTHSSMLAAAAIYVSREMLGCTELWNKAFAYYTKYSEKELQETARSLRHLLMKMHRSKLKGAHSKYTHTSFHGISNHSSLMHISLHPQQLWPEELQQEGYTTTV